MSRFFIYKVLILGLANLSMYEPLEMDLLEEPDYQQQKKSYKNGPTLHSVDQSDEFWESFNKWHCFSTEHMDLLCSEYVGDQNQDIKVPSVLLTKDNHRYEFETSLVDRYNCEEVLGEWEIMAEGQSSICIFAAEIPIKSLHDDDRSLWIISRIKTGKGYWSNSLD